MFVFLRYKGIPALEVLLQERVGHLRNTLLELPLQVLIDLDIIICSGHCIEYLKRRILYLVYCL